VTVTEQDKQFKKILTAGAEKASGDFTLGVMNRLQESFSYEPIISNRLRKIFMICYGSVVILILLLCVFLNSNALPRIDWISDPPLTAGLYRKLLTFIVCFWLIYAINAFVYNKTRRWNN
jgi:hypothetical protein